MNIKQIEKLLTASGIEPGEAKVEAKMFVKHFLKLSDIDLAIKDEFEESNDLLDAIKLRTETKKPIQQILGYAYFMGENFIVNENVLIPRDETEILVRKAIELIKDNSFKKVLDIGAGSGCIACMIAKLTEAQVIGVDVSLDALQTALDNSSKLGLYNKALFRKSNIFSNVHDDEKFDIIISNPPYIPASGKQNLQIEVSFEPELALFTADEKGVEFYEKIIMDSSKYLNSGGYLMFEVGICQANEVKTLMSDVGFKNIEIIKDLANIDRVVIGEY